MPADKRFAWLISAIRRTHPEPGIRKLQAFTRHFYSTAQAPLAPETIRKLERGQIRFTIERCRDFEHALELPAGALVDVYCRLKRVYDEKPVTKTLRVKELGPLHLALLLRWKQHDCLTPLEWLELAYLFSSRPDLLTDRSFSDELFNTFLDQLGTSYERDERLMVEAAVVFGDLLLPYLQDRIAAAPTQLFNVTEALGHNPTPSSVATLKLLTPLLNDDFTAPMALEAASRIKRFDPSLLDTQEDLNAILHEYAMHHLKSTTSNFMTQEEALAQLRLPGEALSATDRKILHSRMPENAELSLRYIGCRRRDLSDLVNTRLRQQWFQPGLSRTVLIPGLTELILEGLTLPGRRDRLAIGALLAPWPGSEAVTSVVGVLVTGYLSGTTPALQRSAIRLMTKMQQPSRRDYLLRLAKDKTLDDTVRFMVAWDLGQFKNANSSLALRSLIPYSSLPCTRRGIVIAATRQRNLPVLLTFSNDRDPIAASEARTALQRLRATKDPLATMEHSEGLEASDR